MSHVRAQDAAASQQPSLFSWTCFFVLRQKSRQHLRADLKLAASPCRGILWLQGGGPRCLPQTFHYAFQLAQTLLIIHGSDPLMLDAPVYFPQDVLPSSPPPHPPPRCALSVWWWVCLGGQITTCSLFMGRPNYTHVVLYVFFMLSSFHGTLNTLEISVKCLTASAASCRRRQ